MSVQVAVHNFRQFTSTSWSGPFPELGFSCDHLSKQDYPCHEIRGCRAGKAYGFLFLPHQPSGERSACHSTAAAVGFDLL